MTAKLQRLVHDRKSIQSIYIGHLHYEEHRAYAAIQLRFDYDQMEIEALVPNFEYDGWEGQVKYLTTLTMPNKAWAAHVRYYMTDERASTIEVEAYLEKPKVAATLLHLLIGIGYPFIKDLSIVKDITAI